MPSTWYPVWIFLIFAISAGVAVFGCFTGTEHGFALAQRENGIGRVNAQRIEVSGGLAL